VVVFGCQQQQQQQQQRVKRMHCVFFKFGHLNREAKQRAV
jgi:hypothetical protein